MVSSLKNRIVVKLVQSKLNPSGIKFEKDGEKYVLTFTALNLRVIISKECIDFFVENESVCLKVSDEVYRFVSIMYVLYKILPFAFALKRVIDRLLLILSKR